MHKPKALGTLESEFWDTHAPELKKRRILTQNSLNSFVILCQTWALLQQIIEKIKALEPDAENYREMAQRHALTKDYVQFAKQFGLLPADAKKTKLEDEDETDGVDEFGV